MQGGSGRNHPAKGVAPGLWRGGCGAVEGRDAYAFVRCRNATGGETSPVGDERSASASHCRRHRAGHFVLPRDVRGLFELAHR